jgi:hypothetical protein
VQRQRKKHRKNTIPILVSDINTVQEVQADRARKEQQLRARKAIQILKDVPDEMRVRRKDKEKRKRKRKRKR